MDPMAPATPSRHRRWAGIVSAALLLAIVSGAAAWWIHARQLARAGAVAAYDLDHAMELAGLQVPDDVESFYFFVLDPAADGESGELAQKLVQAAEERDFIGIAGADSDHNRDVLVAALAITGTRDLKGLVIIYVGPPDHEAALARVVNATGAQLKFVPYSIAEPETI
jgi:hypothetical protein